MAPSDDDDQRLVSKTYRLHPDDIEAIEGVAPLFRSVTKMNGVVRAAIRIGLRELIADRSKITAEPLDASELPPPPAKTPPKKR
jgi:hypothetical protein